MATPRLNYDVLLHVLIVAHAQSYWRRHNILPMMQTCKTLQQGGARLLLSNGVTIMAVNALESFCHFMLADETRFHSLQRLSLSLDPLPNKEVGLLLARVFERASHLVELSIHDSASLDDYPEEVLVAFASMPSLMELSFASGKCLDRDKLHDMFLRFRSPLKSLTAYFYDTRYDGFPDPVKILEGLAPHLEYLSVDCAEFANTEGPQFPRLRSLICREVTNASFIKPLIHSFPNLTCLDAPNSYDFLEAELEEYRQTNILDQYGGRRWQRLDSLEGPISVLYGLAIQCPVRTMRITAVSPSESQMLRAVLHDTPPTNLSVDARHWLSPPELDVFSGVAAQHLRSLDLNISLGLSNRYPVPDLTVQETFDLILATLRSTQLTCFRLTFHWEEPLDEREVEIDEGIYGCDYPPHPITQGLQLLDPVVCARQIIEHVSTIKVIFFKWAHPSCQRMFGAEVEENEEGVRSLKSLSGGSATVLSKRIESQWDPRADRCSEFWY